MIEEFTDEELRCLSIKERVKARQRGRDLYPQYKKTIIATVLKWQKEHREEFLAYKRERAKICNTNNPPPARDYNPYLQREIINKCLKKARHYFVRARITKGKLKELFLEIETNKARMYMEEKMEIKEKKKLLCIVGVSGAGKTLASLHLKNKCGANVICSFTTRKPRKTEVEGRDHHFVDIWPPKEDMLAYAIFGTDHHKYYALKSQVYGPCTVYVVDEEGLNYIKTHWEDEYDIHAIYIVRRRSLRKASGVDVERMNRDAFRWKLPDDAYDYIIRNDGTKSEFFKKIEEIYYNLVGGKENA